jgi:hypothetical protein
MLTQGNGSTSFSVSACHTSATAANVVATQNLYLTEDTSAKKVYARAGSSSGTAYGGISTQATYNAGHTAGLHDYYDSSYWSHSDGSAYVPNRDNTGNELWFTYPSHNYGYQTLYYAYDYPGGRGYASAGTHNWWYE